jgi:TRAP transporter 4TM/12TM fusion protein
MLQRPLHVVFALLIAFVSVPAWKARSAKSYLWNFLPALVVGAIGLYVLYSIARVSTRMELVDKVLLPDLFFGTALILLVLEACRRTAGSALTIIGGIFILYAFLGPYCPGVLAHRGITLERFIDIQFLSAQGLFSEPIGVSAEVVFYFVLFGAFLDKSGVGLLFTDMANAVTGRMRGGPAKASVISSALFGTISGSAVANVVVDGVFTIPMMKKNGYEPHFAAAVEATASTGGQIMPPVMGAAAFLMADLTGVSYSQIIIYAAVPAVLYYVALFLMVDFEARKRGLKAAQVFDFSSIKEGFFQRIHLILPIIALVYFIMDVSLTRATFLSILAVLGVSLLRRATWMDPKKIIGAMKKGATEAINVAIPSAVAGIIVGVIVYTGLGLKFTGFLIQISGGHLFPALFLTMTACIILGMGMPTSAAYLIAAVLMAPALINMGIPVIVAHMFVFYFSVISMITPPVALASYAAATIAEAGIWETGFTAFKLAMTAFLVPYAFVYNHAILFLGSLSEIVWGSVITALATLALSLSLIGFLYVPVSKPQRILLFICTIALCMPWKMLNLVGLAPFALVLFYQWKRRTTASELVKVPEAVASKIE